MSKYIDFEGDAVGIMHHIDKNIKRIAEALEKMVEFMTPFPLVKEGEKSVVRGDPPSALSTDSTPLPKVVETQNFVDVRECTHYSEKSYKLIGYDSKYCYIAKSHVIRTEAIEEGGTRVIVGVKSAWVLDKLGWK